jgi:hypothetical protein
MLRASSFRKNRQYASGKKASRCIRSLGDTLARAHRWQKLLDEGNFGSVSELAREIGFDVSFAARLLRFSLLAPNIIEAILAGEEPSGSSLTTLTKQLPVLWWSRNNLGVYM